MRVAQITYLVFTYKSISLAILFENSMNVALVNCSQFAAFNKENEHIGNNATCAIEFATEIHISKNACAVLYFNDDRTQTWIR